MQCHNFTKKELPRWSFLKCLILNLQHFVLNENAVVRELPIKALTYVYPITSLALYNKNNKNKVPSLFLDCRIRYLTLSRSCTSEYLFNCSNLAFFSRTAAIVIFFLSISSLKHLFITSFSSFSSLVAFLSSRKTLRRVALSLPAYLFFSWKK